MHSVFTSSAKTVKPFAASPIPAATIEALIETMLMTRPIFPSYCTILFVFPSSSAISFSVTSKQNTRMALLSSFNPLATQVQHRSYEHRPEVPGDAHRGTATMLQTGLHLPHVRDRFHTIIRRKTIRLLGNLPTVC